MEDVLYKWIATFEDGRSYEFVCHRAGNLMDAMLDFELDRFNEYQDSIDEDIEAEAWDGWFSTEENDLISIVRGEKVSTPQG